MSIIIKSKLIIIAITTLFFVSSCGTENPEPDPHPSGKLSFEFQHKIDNNSIIYDTFMYVNDAGNHYLISEIQYFISDVMLHKNNGTSVILSSWEDIHYVDTDIIKTQTYTFYDEIAIGIYDKLSFTFGIVGEKNNSLLFVNPPESFMFWPENLGGGYHYMKLNGKWINELEQVSPYNFHLGIGQIYDSYPDSISGFVQNYFTVEMDDFPIEIIVSETRNLEIIMNVENWFRSPNIYDHNTWGGDIMQKQEAMQLAVENGKDVFTYKIK